MACDCPVFHVTIALGIVQMCSDAHHQKIRAQLAAVVLIPQDLQMLYAIELGRQVPKAAHVQKYLCFCSSKA